MTLSEYWVTIRVPEVDATALEKAVEIQHDERVAGVIWEEPSDGSAIVAFQIRAPSQVEPGDMRVFNEAQEAYGELRKTAGLSEERGGMLTSMELRVLPDTGEPLPPRVMRKPASLPHDRKLLQAQTVYVHSRGELGEYAHAVTLACTACEMAVTRAMRRLMAAKVADLHPALERLIGNRFALTDKRVVALWDALAGDEIAKANFWPRYQEVLDLRQSITHEGESASRAQAEAAVTTARDLCDHVTRLAP